MIPEQYAEMARRWVRRAWVEAPPRPPADRRRLVGAVEHALRSRARRRVMFRWGSGVGTVAFAVAAGLLLAPRLGLFSPPAPVAKLADSRPAATSVAAPVGNGSRTLTVLSATGDTSGDAVAGPVAHGMTLEAGIELVAPRSGQIRIGTAEGTALTLEPGSRLTVSEDTATQRFALGRGAVRARVAKLHAGERFIINTSDAEIEVHGTAFRVALVEPESRCAGGSATRVSVSEGVVTVRSGGRTARLLPGDEWPKEACPVAGGEAAASVAGPRRSLRRAAFAASRSRAVASSPSPAPSVSLPPSGPVGSDASPAPSAAPVAAPLAPPSVLAIQNDLFAAAVRAKRQGRSSDAIRLFAGLVQQYPNGPLVESALAQRMKLLGAVDPRAAVDAATDYLVRFPGGFARSDARALVHPTARP